MPFQRRSHSAREERRNEGAQRDAAWRELTPTEQLRSLDSRLGTGLGAVRQRNRLAKKLEKTETPVSAPPNGGAAAGGFTTTTPKKAKKRTTA